MPTLAFVLARRYPFLIVQSGTPDPEKVMRFFHNPALARFTWAAFRIMFGLTFATHGLQKLFGMFGGVDGKGMTVPLVSLFGLAGVLELGGGLLIALGLLTRPVAFVLAGEMAVAYFMGHVAPSGSILPPVNKGEPPVLYCFAWLFLAFHGAGPFSVDESRERRPATIQ
jgi:putative oxidoreductase